MQKKVLLSLAVISISTIAHAESDSMNSLSYRVKGKEFHYNFGLEFGKPTYNTSLVNAALTTTAAANTDHGSYENSIARWTNDFSYGVTDSFSIALGLDLALTNSLKQTAESLGSTPLTTFSTLDRNNDGLLDIRLNSSYRYLTGDLKADLLVGLAISGKSKQAAVNTNSSGNYVVSKGEAKTGGSSILLGTQFAGAMGAFEWATAVGLNYNMNKKVTVVAGDKNASGGLTDYEKEIYSKMDLSLALAGQYNLNSAYALGASVAFDFAAKKETSYFLLNGTNPPSATTVATEKAHTDVTLALDGKYQVMTNIALGLNYSHLFAANIDGSAVTTPTFGAATTYTTPTTDRKDDRLGFNVAVRF